jgi:hypothetical protein
MSTIGKQRYRPQQRTPEIKPLTIDTSVVRMQPLGNGTGRKNAMPLKSAAASLPMGGDSTYGSASSPFFPPASAPLGKNSNQNFAPVQQPGGMYRKASVPQLVQRGPPLPMVVMGNQAGSAPGNMVDANKSNNINEFFSAIDISSAPPARSRGSQGPMSRKPSMGQQPQHQNALKANWASNQSQNQSQNHSQNQKQSPKSPGQSTERTTSLCLKIYGPDEGSIRKTRIDLVLVRSFRNVYHTVFNKLKLHGENNYLMGYMDDAGDFVRMTSDEDVEAALDEACRDNKLALCVVRGE